MMTPTKLLPPNFVDVIFLPRGDARFSTRP